MDAVTLSEFLQLHPISRIRIVSSVHPVGKEYVLNTDGDITDEDWCDEELLMTLLPVSPPGWENSITGIVVLDQEGEYRWYPETLVGIDLQDRDGNSVQNISVWGTESNTALA
jgi:hypothetical protein